jgi:K+-transporting ATPase ATPase C chain
LSEQLRPLLLSVPLLTLLTGVAFPLVLTVITRPVFPHQAGGSLIGQEGQIVGSELMGQAFTSPTYFHPRPSAAGTGYDGTASGGTSFGPSNSKLWEDTRLLADEYRRVNELSPETVIPIEAVTRSGSGLDPHISPANAELQLPRVVRERKISEDEVRRLIAEHTDGRQFGIFGEPRVNVLSLNLALDQLAPH